MKSKKFLGLLVVILVLILTIDVMGVSAAYAVAESTEMPIQEILSAESNAGEELDLSAPVLPDPIESLPADNAASSAAGELHNQEITEIPDPNGTQNPGEPAAIPEQLLEVTPDPEITETLAPDETLNLGELTDNPDQLLEEITNPEITETPAPDEILNPAEPTDNPDQLLEETTNPEITETLAPDGIQNPAEPTDNPDQLLEETTTPEITETPAPDEILNPTEPTDNPDHLLEETTDELSPDGVLIPDDLSVNPAQIVTEKPAEPPAMDGIMVPSLGKDPWFYVGSALYQFTTKSGTCAVGAVCDQSEAPFQKAINYISDNRNTLFLSLGTTLLDVKVEKGTITEDLEFKDFDTKTMPFSLQFTGGCDAALLTCPTSPAVADYTTLNGKMTFSNVNVPLTFKNFRYGDQIILNNATNITLNGAAAEDKNKIEVVDQAGYNEIKIVGEAKDSDGNPADTVAVTTDRSDHFVSAEIEVGTTTGPLIGEDIIAEFKPAAATTPPTGMKISTRSVAKLDVSAYTVDDLSYSFEKLQEEYSLKQGSSTTTMDIVSSSFGTVSFSNPKNSLTINTNAPDTNLTVNSFNNETYTGTLSLIGNRERNDIAIKTDLLLKGKDLTIKGGKVTVDSGKTLSTRSITGTDYKTADSIAASGNILIEAVNLVLDNVSILAQGSTGFTGGDVTILAQDTGGMTVRELDFIRELLSFVIGNASGIYVNAADVILKDSLILANNVSIDAKSGYDMTESMAETIAEILNGAGIGEFLNGLIGISGKDVADQIAGLGILDTGLVSFPLGASVRISWANIELTGNTKIKAENDVTINAAATGNADVSVLSKYFSMAVGVSVVNSFVKILDAAEIVSTAGDILIQSDANGNASVSAATDGNKADNLLPISFGVGVSVLNSIAETAKNTKLDAFGSVNILANGANIGGAEASVMIYNGGAQAIELAAFVGVSNVKALAEGKIFAKTTSEANSFTPINLEGVKTNGLYIPNHGLVTGQKITYHAAKYQQPISGLKDGEQYTVIRIDKDNIALVTADPIHLSSAGVESGVVHTFTPYNPKTFYPNSTVLDETTSTFNITGHGFVTGQKILYSSLMEDPIGGLLDSVEYEVIRVDDNSFQLKLNGESVTGLKLPKNPENEQSFWFMDAAKSKTFIPNPTAQSSTSPVNEKTGEIRIVQHDFKTGDMVYYSVPTDIIKRDLNLKYGFIANKDGVDSSKLKITSAGGLETGDFVTYQAGDYATIPGLVSGLVNGKAKEYEIASMTPCDPKDPKGSCQFVELAGVTFGEITPDPKNTGADSYTPIHYLVKSTTYDGGYKLINGLEEQVIYFVVRTGTDYFQLARSLDEAKEIEKGIQLVKPTDTTTVGHQLDLGVTNGIGVRASLITEGSIAASGYFNQDRTAINLLKYTLIDKGTTLAKAGATKTFEWIKKGLGKTDEKTDEEGKKNAEKAASSISVAGGLGVLTNINSVSAIVGSNAVLESNKDIEVFSTLRHVYTSDVENEASPEDGAGTKATIGGSLSVVVLIDHNSARIMDGANLDAKRNIQIAANTSYPSLARETWQAILQASVGDIISAVIESAGSTNFVFAPSFFNNYIRSVAEGSGSSNETKIGIAGSFGFVYLGSDTKALIGNKVKINQKTAFQTDVQSVKVTSAADASFINVAGNFHFDYQPGLEKNKKLDSVKTYIKDFPKSAFSLFGNSGTKNGAGGSIFIPVYIFRSIAEIGDETMIRTGKSGKLTVKADTAVNNITFVQAGAQAADGFALAGAISYVGIFNTTTARIAPTAVILGGPVDVVANDNTDNYLLVGAVAMGTKAGVGASIGVNTILRDVNAIIGNFQNGAAGPWQVLFSTSGTLPITATPVGYFNGDGTITVTAESQGAYDTNEVQFLDGNIPNDTTLTYGTDTTAAISATATAAEIAAELNKLQSIEDAGGVTVTEAEDGGWLIMFKLPGKRSLIISNTAKIEKLEEGATQKTESQQLSLGNATQGGYRLVFQDEKTEVLRFDADAAKIAEALNALKAIKALRSTDNNPVAEPAGSTTPDGSVTVTKDESTGIFTITFSVYGDRELISFEPLLAFDGSVYVKSDKVDNSTQTIFNSAHNGGFYLSYNGVDSKILPYDATYDQIMNALKALSSITSGSVTVGAVDLGTASGTINSSGALHVSAVSEGNNWVLALAAAMTKDPSSSGSSSEKKDSAGSGMPRKHWQKTMLVDMKLAGQNFGKTGQGSLDGGGGGNSSKKVKNAFAVAGDISVNVLIDKVEAAIRNAGLLTASSVSVYAENQTSLRTAAGAAALAANGEGTSFGIAGSVSFNWLDGFTRAAIENVKFGASTANTTAPGTVIVSAVRSGDIIAMAAGASGALKEKGIGIAGSVAINVLKNQTEAILSGLKQGSKITGSVEVAAQDLSRIIGVAGSASYGGKAGFGVAFTLNLIKNSTNAYFRESDLAFSGDLNLMAAAENSIISAAGAVGISKDAAGVGATIAIDLLLNQVNAVMDKVTASSPAANKSALISAQNKSTIISAAGSLGGAKKTGIGIAIAFNLIQPKIHAKIIDSTLSMGNAVNLKSSIIVSARDSSSITAVSAGGAGAEKVAVAAGISANIILTEIESSITGTTSKVTASGDISVLAEGKNDIYAFSGTAAGAGKFAGGAAVSFNMSELKSKALVDGAKLESLAGNIFIKSSASGEMIALAAGASGAGKVAIGGSVVIGVLNNDIEASANNYASLTAEESVNIQAEDKTSAILVAGVAGGAGTAAVGLSNSTFISNNAVISSIGENVKVKGKGKKAVIQTLGADIATAGSWTFINRRGVFVSAVSDHAVRIFAAVGEGAGQVSVSGSGTLSILNDTVKATIGEKATVDAGDSTSEADLSNPLTVSVFAASKTTMWGVAGAISGAGTVGVGVGIDVGVLTKNVEASVNGTVTSLGDIIVQALSSEQIISVSASLGGAGTVGVSSSTGVYSLNLTTEAKVGSKAVLSAQGSLLVNAYDDTLAVLTAGSISSGGTVGVGTSLDISVSSKKVYASIDKNAKVDALGNGNGLVSFSGSYKEEYKTATTPENSDVDVKIIRPTFDPATAVDNTTGTITLETDPGYKTGDSVVYSSGLDKDDKENPGIGGLENGRSYYLIVDPAGADGKTKIRLALDYQNAMSGIAIPLDNSTATGTNHSIWNGTISPSGFIFNLPGQAFPSDMNDDDEDDGAPNTDALSKDREGKAETISFNGIAVSAVNKDSLLTFVASAGGAGTVAVNVTGLVNVVNIDVKAAIGESALINQTANLKLNTTASVYVLAGNDFFHIGVVPSANGSGTVGVSPAIDVTVYSGNTAAVIADGALVKAAMDVIVNANAKEQIISVVAGVAVSGVAGVGGTIGVVTIVNETLASIGDNDLDSTGATVTTDGNVLVNAYDDTQVVLVAGNLAIGFTGAGVGGSIGVLVEIKKTSALIAPYSKVTANGKANGIINKAYQKSMGTDGSFSVYDEVKGVIVQAYSNDQVVTVVGTAGGGLYAGVAGSVLVDVFLSDTTAMIGSNAVVTSGGDVLVTALNHSKIFNFAGSVSLASVGVSGSLVVDVIRNNAKAIVGSNAVITAVQHVQVAALSNKDTTTVSATGSLAGLGIGASLLVNVIGDEFAASFKTSYEEYERDMDGNIKKDADGNPIVRKDTIEKDPFASKDKDGKETSGKENISNTFNTLDDGKDLISGAIDSSADDTGDDDSVDYFVLLGKKLDSVSTGFKNVDIVTAGKDALGASGLDAKSGTIAVIEKGAKIILSASDSVLDVIAEERVKYLAIGGSVTGGGSSVAGVASINVIGSNVNAIIDSGAKLTAVTINVDANLITDLNATVVAGTAGAMGGFAGQAVVVYDHANTAAGIGDDLGNKVIIHADNISVNAKSTRKVMANAASAALSGGVAGSVSIALSIVDGQTLAWLEKIENAQNTTDIDNPVAEPFEKVSVNALSELETQTLTINLAGGSAVVTAGLALNIVKPDIEAYISGSSIDSDSVAVISGLRTKMIITANSAAVSATFAGGLNIAIGYNDPDLKAYIQNSDLFNQSDILIKTFYNYDDDNLIMEKYGQKVISVGIAGSTVAVGGNISAAHSSIDAATRMDGTLVKKSTGTIRLISKIYNKFEAYATGASAGAVAIAVNMAVAENSSSRYVAAIDGSTFVNGYGILIDNYVSERAYAETIGGSASILGSGVLNVSVAVLEPKVISSITNLGNSSFIEIDPLNLDPKRAVKVFAQYDGDAATDAVGVVVSGTVSIGASVAVSYSSPVINAYIESDSANEANQIASNILWQIEARQNINEDGSKVDTGAKALASASGGGVYTGTGSIAIAKNHATIKSWMGHRGTTDLTDLLINAYSYNKSEAKIYSLSIGGLSMGASIATAISDGNVEAWYDSSSTTDVKFGLKDIEYLTIKAITYDDAYAYSVSGVGGIVSINGSVATAEAATNTSADIRGSILLNSYFIDLISLAVPQARTEAWGVNAGALTVGASVATSTVKPAVSARIQVNINAVLLNVLAQKIYTDINGFEIYNAKAYAVGAVGALFGVNATVAKAIDKTSVTAFVVDGVRIKINKFELNAVNLSRQQAKTTNLLVSVIAAGGSDAKSESKVNVLAALGNNVTIDRSYGSSASVTVSANSEVDHLAQSSAGTGGLLAGSITKASSASVDETKALVGTGNKINVTTFKLLVAHLTKANTSMLSIAGGVVATSGIQGENDVNSTVIAGIGSNSQITAELIVISALNKTDIQDTQSGTTGGVISGAAASSLTKIKLTTRTSIGTSVTLKSTGMTKSLHQILISAENIVNAKSNLTFTTGGALTDAAGNNTISAKDVLAEVLIGSGSQILSNGAMAISARGSGILNGATDIETFGAGTVMTGNTRVEIYPKNSIIIMGGGTKLEAQNDLTLAAGRNTQPTVFRAPDTYKVHARWDGFAGSAFPIDNVNAYAYAVQTNLIRIDSGSTVRSGNQLSLYAEKDGAVDLLGKAKVVSWVSKAADGLAKIFDKNSTELFSGQSLAENHATIEMNGIAETGFNRNQQITFKSITITINDSPQNANFDPAKNTYSVTTDANSNIPYTIGISKSTSPLVEALQNAQAMLANFGSTNATLKSYYEEQIVRIKNEMAKYYSPLTFTDEKDPSTSVTVVPTGDVIAITIPQIIAAAGRIDIRTGILQGSGTFDAPGNSHVEIINETHAFLNIMGIRIPDDNGGIYLNSARVEKGANTIAESNAREVEILNRFNQNGVDPVASAGTAAFTLSDPPIGNNSATVVIKNTVILTDYDFTVIDGTNFGIDQEVDLSKLKNSFLGSLRWPGITILSSLNGGTGIYNPNGPVDINAGGGESSLRILNTIQSIKPTFISGGDIYVEGLTSFSVGGETLDILNQGSGVNFIYLSVCGTLPDLYLCQKSFFYTIGGGVGNVGEQQYANFVKNPSNSTLMGDRILIKAQHININGNIQSGRDKYTLTITDASWNEAVRLMQNKQGRIYLKNTSDNNPGFNVYYNTISNQFETDPIKSRGGYVELHGKILNTGPGQIKILNGYPTVTIVNETNVNVKIGGIDLSQASEGTLLINDLAGGTPVITSAPNMDTRLDDKPYLSIFTNEDGKTYLKTSGSKDTSVKVQVTGTTFSYQPDKSWYYGWATVQETTKVRYAYKRRAEWLDFIPDVFQIKEEDWESWSSTEPRDGGNGPYYFKDDSTTRGDVKNWSDTTSTFRSDPMLIYSNTYWTWYLSKVYEATYKQIEGTQTIYNHEVNAHQPIGITFIGSPTGKISIKSSGSGNVVLEGALLNAAGDISITTQTGGIYAVDESGKVTAKNISLEAGSDIGLINNPLPLQLAGNTGALTAKSSSGNIYVKHLSGDLRVNEINSVVGNTGVISAGSIVSGTNMISLITGNNITLNAGKGIGSISKNLKINSNTSNWNGKVNVTALEDIYLAETIGDLNLEKMTTNGKVYLEVLDGSLVDANKLQTRDERTYQELLDTVYSRLQLLNETDAAKKIENLYQSVIYMKNQEYRTYWNYRLMQEIPAVYDADFIVDLTDAEKQYYTDYYQQQGMSAEEIAAALETLVNARTEQYHVLHAAYGKPEEKAFNEEYSYILTDDEKTDISKNVKIWTEDELLQLISANLMKPVSSTMTNIEDPNIVAKNITLKVIGTIGIFAHDPISLPIVNGSLDVLTDEQKIALAAAERSDVEYVGPKVDSVTMSVSSGKLVLTAPSSSSWEEMGFSTTGMEVHLRNPFLNWFFVSEMEGIAIDSINGLEMTLSLSRPIAPIFIYYLMREKVDVTSLIVNPKEYLTQENAKVSALNIYSRDDINVDSNGILNASAGAGIYLGGGVEMQGDLNLGLIESLSGGEIRIRSHRNVLNSANIGKLAVNVLTSGDVVLEAGNGSIGLIDNPIITAISGKGMLTARAAENVYISQVQMINGKPFNRLDHPYLTCGTAADLNISSVYAQSGEIVIRTDGSILDGENTNFTKLLGKHVSLLAGDGIGKKENPLEVHTYFSADQPGNGWLKAVALNNIYLNDPDGDMGALQVFSCDGDVTLSALGSILDPGDLKNPEDPASELQTDSVNGRWPRKNIIGNNISLTALTGGIGAADNELDIDSRYGTGNGVLTVASGNSLNTYLIETDGDVWLNTVTTGKNVITFITVPSGSIFNGAATGVFNINSGKTKLFARDNIGASDKKLESMVGALEGKTTTGGLWIHNQGALIIGQVTDNPVGISSEGDVVVTASSPITFASDTNVTGTQTYTAGDSAGSGDDITIEPGVSITGSGSLVLNAGDNLVVEAGAAILVEGDLILRADYNLSGIDPDPGLGGVVTLHGTIIPGVVEDENGLYSTNGVNWVYIQTYADNDVIHLYTPIFGFITTGAGDDEIKFYNWAHLDGTGNVKFDGNDVNIGTIDGGSGKDRLDYSNYMNAVDVQIIGKGTIDGFEGIETGSISFRFDNIDLLTGSALKTDKLTGTNASSIWHVYENGTIDLTIGGTTLNFNGFETLISGSGNDTILFENGAVFTGSIITNSGIDTLDLSKYTTAVDIELTGVGTNEGFKGYEHNIIGYFDNVENVVGSQSSGDILRGLNEPATWNLLTSTSGNYLSLDRTLGFSSIELLKGGSDQDKFVFADGVTFSGSIDGGAGKDILSNALSAAPITVTLTGIGTLDGFNGTQPTLTGSFANIDRLEGSLAAGDTLNGLDSESLWKIAPNGMETYSSCGRTLEYVGIETLQGGSKEDRFAFLGDAVHNGSINTGLGYDTLDYSAYGSAVQINLTALSGLDGFAGSATGITGGFSNVNALVASPYSDKLTGIDDASLWNIKTDFGGTYSSSGNKLDYSGVESLAGGSGSDQFVIANAVTQGGTIDGGAGSNSLDYSLRNTPANFSLSGMGSVTGFSGTESSLNAKFDNITELIGSSLSDTLTGLNQNSVWDILADGTENYLSGGNALHITNIESLTGGSAQDTFRVEPGSNFLGTINGGLGSNWLDYSNYFTPVSVNLTTGSATDLVTGNYRNIANVIGGAGNDLLIGDAKDNRLIGGAGNDILYGLDGNDVLNGGAGMDQLFGGKGNDVFTFTGSETLDDKIDGGAGLNTLDFSGSDAGVQIKLAGIGALNGFSGSQVGQTGAFNNISNLIGSSFTDGLYGLNVQSIWEIGQGTNAYLALGRSLTFTGIDDLIGGKELDTFLFKNGGTFTGTIDGGPIKGNSLDFSNYRTPVYVDLSTNSYSAMTGTITNILQIIGGQANDVLIGNDLANIIDGGPGNDLIYGLGGNDVLMTGDGDNIVFGGDGNDIIFSGLGSNTLYGGAGYDIADIAWTGSYWIPLKDIELVILHYPDGKPRKPQILVIDVVSRQTADLTDELYEGFLVRLPSLDQVLIYRGAAQKIVLTTDDDRGGQLPADLSLFKMMVVQLLNNGIQIKQGLSQFLISFLLPAGADPSRYAIYYWDEDAGIWLEIPASYAVDPVNASRGRLEAWVSRTGKYVLVYKGQ